MKISMPCESLSMNSLLRVYPFAKFLSEDFNVEIIGNISKTGIFPPIKKEKLNFSKIKEKKVFPYYLYNSYEMYKKLDGKVIHVFKPLFRSFAAPLVKKLFNKKKIILDIDDWESQYMIDNFFSYNPIKLGKFLLADLYIPESYFIKKILEKISKRVDAIITSSMTLQRRFGGTWIPTGADVDYFDPEKFSPRKIRKEFDIKKNDNLLLFTGTPKKHKGTEVLIEAIKEVRKENKNTKLLIVGADKSIPYVKKLKKIKGVILTGFRDHKEMPYFLKAADIVCIPQLDIPSANAQLPIKVFEPMAMEKAVITTNTTDMKYIFDGCGTVIRPGSIFELKKAILKYANCPRLRKKHGKLARKKCKKEFSWKIMKKKTLEVYEKINAI